MLKLIFGPINTAVGSNYLSLLLELAISGRRHRYDTMSCFTRFSALLRRLLLGRRALNVQVIQAVPKSMIYFTIASRQHERT